MNATGMNIAKQARKAAATQPVCAHNAPADAPTTNKRESQVSRDASKQIFVRLNVSARD
jgi:DNA repair protein RadC